MKGVILNIKLQMTEAIHKRVQFPTILLLEAQKHGNTLIYFVSNQDSGYTIGCGRD